MKVWEKMHEEEQSETWFHAKYYEAECVKKNALLTKLELNQKQTCNYQNQKEKDEEN